MKGYSTIVGIDLGTTNSLVAVASADGVVVVPNALGHRFTPSVLHMPTSGKVTIGHQALHARVSDPKHTVYAAKRFMGRKYNEVFDLAERMHYGISLDEHHHAAFELANSLLLPQVASALVLKSLKASAEQFIGCNVTGAVISVPAYFNSAQRAATIEAAELAGLHVARLLEEPTAAAMACRRPSSGDAKVAVLDLGGGTFDVTIVEVCDVDGEMQYEVLSVTGDGYLGGDDFDERLAQWLVETVEYEHRAHLPRDAETRGRFMDAAIAAKHALSEQLRVRVTLQHLRTGGDKAIDFSYLLDRQMFEALCGDLFERLLPPCLEALRIAGLDQSTVDQVILVGGASRMPRVRSIAESVFGRAPHSSVNPFEAIALGAAIQGAVLGGHRTDVLLLDVATHTVGLEGVQGQTIRMIKHNTTIPTKYSQTFRPAAGASSVQVRVLEGDAAMARENRLLGTIAMADLSVADASRLEVSFDIDTNRILHVELLEKATGRKERTVFRPDSGLSDSQRHDMRALTDALWKRSL